MEELVIVGAGPAGMTAALYAARKGLRPYVLSEDLGGQANWSSRVENYMGFKDIRGSELMERFAEQVKAQGVAYEEGRVARVERREGGFGVRTAYGREHAARAVIVATGKRPRPLGVPGEAEFRGRGVSYCVLCDAPLYRGAAVAVVGGGNAGFQAAYDLLGSAREVHLLTDRLTADETLRRRVLGRPGLILHEGWVVKAILGGEAVHGLVATDGEGREKELAVEGIFVEIGLLPNGEVVEEAVARNEAGEIVVDCACRTNLPGLFAAGDVTNACGKQIIIAAGEGAKAALAAADYLAFADKAVKSVPLPVQ
ncbi:MAG: FAD-dependent oxidoreductase [Firmicutes bacterium]|nr:FAD-dependent oxidoreductase [Bacillota bacterium]